MFSKYHTAPAQNAIGIASGARRRIINTRPQIVSAVLVNFSSWPQDITRPAAADRILMWYIAPQNQAVVAKTATNPPAAENSTVFPRAMQPRTEKNSAGISHQPETGGWLFFSDVSINYL